MTKSKNPNCNRCGNFHNNMKRQCAFVTRQHPDINPDPQVPWSDCAKGKHYKSRGKTSLTWNQDINGKSLNWPQTSGMIAATIRFDNEPDTNLTPNNIITLRCVQQHTDGERDQLTAEIPMRKTLLDSGSFTFTIISKRVVDMLLDNKVRVETKKIKVGLNSPLKGGGNGHICHEAMKLNITYLNELKNVRETICVDAVICDIDIFDIIVSKHDLERHDLLRKCAEYIYSFGATAPTIESVLTQLSNQIIPQSPTTQATPASTINAHKRRRKKSFLHQDKFHNLSRPKRHKTREKSPTKRQIWRCASCHSPNQGRLNINTTCGRRKPSTRGAGVRVVGDETEVERKPSTRGTDSQLRLCACCHHISNQQIENVRDNVDDAYKDDCLNTNDLRSPNSDVHN